VAKKRRMHSMKSKDSKRFVQEASQILGVDLGQILGTKIKVDVNETELAELYILNGRPLLAKSNQTLFPTLLFKEVFFILPQIVVDMGAVPYVCKGADVMAPGVVDVEGKFNENNILLVVDERHRKPLAVVLALYSSEALKNVDRGKAARTLHYVGDKLWDYLKEF